MPPNPNKPFPVTVHPFDSPTADSCAYEQGHTTSRNALVFIGGLSDGPHSSGFVRVLAESIRENKDLDFSLFEFRMRSSFSGYGVSSLKNDVEDISAMVRYLRSIGREKIVLMGHSTGTQDCMEYTNYARHGSEPVEGFVLLAPVSDREILEEFFPTWRDSLTVAEKMIADGKQEELMPVAMVPPVLNVPMTAYRFWSIVAAGADDDYFSTDLDEKVVDEVWSYFKKPVLVLHCEKDEFVPSSVDSAALNKKYQQLNPVVSSLSGLVPNTGHTVQQDDARQWLCERVLLFLQKEIAS